MLLYRYAAFKEAQALDVLLGILRQPHQERDLEAGVAGARLPHDPDARPHRALLGPPAPDQAGGRAGGANDCALAACRTLVQNVM